ncbi:MAG: Prenyltransferase and squalene oxidase repeat protein [Methanocella sp. PtaU1.Bin125]|nr:MAG: Prenyltransferase and squalene oxidase repeat protein [Methanocella sp. PtaU1.Bin125]
MTFATPDTLRSATRYLEKTQHADGSWADGDPFVCARGCAALAAYDGDEMAKVAGRDYLERLQAEDGHFPGKSGMYTDAACTAYALIVLNRFHYSKASLPVSRGLLWLLEAQNPDGSWRGRNANKNAYTTSLCLRALHTFYLYGLAKYRKGVAHVLEKVGAPGFFDEPVSHVYAPVLNLRRIDQLPADIETSFLAYAETRAGKAIEAGQIADVAYLAGTLGAPGESRLRSRCTGWLQEVQNPDGGFGKEKGAVSDPNWTALVVLAMGDLL